MSGINSLHIKKDEWQKNIQICMNTASFVSTHWNSGMKHLHIILNIAR